jgi:hypothetical protein
MPANARVCTSKEKNFLTAKENVSRGSIADRKVRGRVALSSNGNGRNYFLRARVRAAFLAATRPVRPFVRTALRAAALRDPAPRMRAAVRACLDSARVDAAARPSRRSAVRVARARLTDGFLRDRERLSECAALRLVLSEVIPFSGGGSSTPARRALESPIAIACFVDRAPCFPSRT